MRSERPADLAARRLAGGLSHNAAAVRLHFLRAAWYKSARRCDASSRRSSRSSSAAARKPRKPEASAKPHQPARRGEKPAGPVVVRREEHTLSRTRIDEDALKVLSRLVRHNHTAYLVGGGVRDLLLDRQVKDFDIATSAHPQEIKNLFRNCRLIGRRFRLAHILFKGRKVIEVSTFRKQAGFSDEADLLITQRQHLRHPRGGRAAGGTSRSTGCSTAPPTARSSTTSAASTTSSAGSSARSATRTSGCARTRSARCAPSGSPRASTSPSTRPRGGR